MFQEKKFKSLIDAHTSITHTSFCRTCICTLESPVQIRIVKHVEDKSETYKTDLQKLKLFKNTYNWYKTHIDQQMTDNLIFNQTNSF